MMKPLQVLSVLVAMGTLAESDVVSAAVEERQSSPTFTVEGNLGFMDGSVKYKIGELRSKESGPLNWTRNQVSWSSELELPLDVPLLELGASARGRLAPRWDWVARLDVWKNFSDPSAKVKDTDGYHSDVSEGFYQVDQWRYVTEQNAGRVYSESSADLDTYGYNAKVRLVQQTDAGPLGWIVGYRCHDLSYDVRGLEGYAQGTEWVGQPSGTLPGIPSSRKVVSYDFWSQIPYVGLGYEFAALDRLHVSIEGDYSPWAAVKDRDRHLLHGTQYESRTKGSAVMFNVSARYDITARWFAQMKADYLRLKTDGDTTKTVYVPTEASPVGMTYHGPIDVSEQETRFSLGVGLAF